MEDCVEFNVPWFSGQLKSFVGDPSTSWNFLMHLQVWELWPVDTLSSMNSTCFLQRLWQRYKVSKFLHPREILVHLKASVLWWLKALQPHKTSLTCVMESFLPVVIYHKNQHANPIYSRIVFHYALTLQWKIFNYFCLTI